MNKKKIIGILLVCIFILVCAGCQKQNVVKEYRHLKWRR